GGGAGERSRLRVRDVHGGGAALRGVGSVAAAYRSQLSPSGGAVRSRAGVRTVRRRTLGACGARQGSGPGAPGAPSARWNGADPANLPRTFTPRSSWLPDQPWSSPYTGAGTASAARTSSRRRSEP